LCKNNIVVLVLQETYTENKSELSNKGRIKGFTLTSTTYHKKYGSATNYRNDISNWDHITTSNVNNVSLIQIRIEEINIVNIKKPLEKLAQLNITTRPTPYRNYSRF